MGREAYMSKYYQDHKELLNERSRQWQRAHSEEVKNRAVERRHSVKPGKAHGTKWTKEEIDILQNSTMTDRELAGELGRTIGSIETKRYELKNPDHYTPWADRTDEEKRKALKSTEDYLKSVEPGFRHYQKWTPTQIEFALDPEYTAKEVAEELGRTIGSVNILRWKHKKGLI